MIRILILARQGALAAGLLVGISVPALAGPGAIPAAPERTPDIILAQVGGDGVCNDRHCSRGNGIGNGSRTYRRDRFEARRDFGRYERRHDQGRRHWRDRNWDRGDWQRRHHRHHRQRNHYRSPDIYIDLDIPTYSLSEPSYVEREYIAPRRYSRGLSADHIDWCYDRYRSYRARDNSFQPYHGPRQQCWSPYS